jgi:hypothetical protein
LWDEKFRTDAVAAGRYVSGFAALRAERLCLSGELLFISFPEAQPQEINLIWLYGKPQAFRTEGGKAAEPSRYRFR